MMCLLLKGTKYNLQVLGHVLESVAMETVLYLVISKRGVVRSVTWSCGGLVHRKCSLRWRPYIEHYMYNIQLYKINIWPYCLACNFVDKKQISHRHILHLDMVVPTLLIITKCIFCVSCLSISTKCCNRASTQHQSSQSVQFKQLTHCAIYCSDLVIWSLVLYM